MRPDQELSQKIIEAVSEIVKGTAWAPPEGGIVVDALVVLIHVDQDGEYASSWLNHGSLEQAEGMAISVKRSIEILHKQRLWDKWDDDTE